MDIKKNYLRSQLNYFQFENDELLINIKKDIKNKLSYLCKEDSNTILFSKNKCNSIVESLVALVVKGIGFIAILQVSAFTISSMDRSMEKTKLNFLSEMIIEDMISNPEKISSYDGFNDS